MNISNVKASIGSGLLLLQMLSLTDVFSQESNPLNEVVITTNRAPQTLADIGKAVWVITAETLAQSQGRTLPEVLNNVAGLTIGGSGTSLGEPKSIYLRGSSAANTLILIDGIPVNDASSPSGEYDISTIPVEIIARVEIIKGGNSTRYGSAAVAGVINIITKQGYNKTPNATMIATAGSYNTFKQALLVSGQIKKNNIAFSVSNLTSEGFSAAMPKNGETNFDNDAFTQRAIGLNVGREINKKLTLRGNFILNSNHTNLDGGAYQDNLGDASMLSYLGGISAQLKVSKGTLNMYLHQNNVKRTSIYDNFKSRISNVETVLNYPFTDFVSLTSGFNHKYFATKKNTLDANSSMQSAFASLFFKTKCGFRAEVGNRYNRHSQYGSNFTYTINPFYLLANQYKIFLNWSSSYRAPSLYQLFDPQYGNLALKPELSTTFEIGADLDIMPKKLHLNLSYFDRQINDAIGWRDRFLNIESSKAHGIELELSVKPHPSIRMNAFYTYTNGKEFKADQTSNPLYRRPINSYGVDLGLTLSRKVNVNVNYKLTGTRTDKDWSNGEAREITLSPYDIVDVYVQYRPKNKLTLFADVKNAFNRDYIDMLGYTTKGLNFNAGMKVELR